MAHTLIAEWWEVWYVPPQDDPVQIPCTDGVPTHPLIPRQAFTSREDARAAKNASRNKYVCVKHVRRYKV